MAKQIALKIWSIILTSVSLLVAGEPARAQVQDVAGKDNTLSKLRLLKSEKPKIFLKQLKVGGNSYYRFAGHRSHSSHASHSSHYSHRSSTGGGYSAPSSPSYLPDTPGSTGSSASKPSSSAPKSSSKSNGTPQANSVVPAAGSHNNLVNTIYFKDGTQSSCESAFESHERVYCIKEGAVREFPLGIIDREKTFGKK